MVNIDGVEYIPVTAKRITVDGVVYAELVLQSESTKPITRIVDGDGDVWRITDNGCWDCHNKDDEDGTGGWYVASREKIAREHRIIREY